MSEPEYVTREELDALIAKNTPVRAGRIRATRSTVGGLTFHSSAERRRYEELQLREKSGQIKELSNQVRFALDVAGVHICDYVADAVYLEKQGRKWVKIVEDTKGQVTDTYSIKRKLMLALHRIKIREIPAGDYRAPRKPRARKK